ncbi:MAG TPA: CvpA family protein [Patescibacteria group bacterium]|nr:CvpA family protein [Patescibacteria group bacterium]
MTPQALDITIAIILVLSMVVAYFRGIIKEAFTIVALVVATGGTYFAGQLMIPAFNKWLKVDQNGEAAAARVSKGTTDVAEAAIAKSHLIFGVLSPEKTAVILSYASVFLIFYLIMSLVGFFVSRAVNEAGLGMMDKVLGAGFGLARGFLVVFLCFLPVSFFWTPDQLPDWAKNSVSVPILQDTVAYVDKHVDLRKLVKDTGNEVVQKINLKAPLASRAKDEARPVTDEEEAEMQRELLEDEKTARP